MFCRYAGEFIQWKAAGGKSRHPSNSSLDNVPTNVLQNILQTAYSLPPNSADSKTDGRSPPPNTADSARTSPQPATAPAPVDPIRQSFSPLEKYMAVKMVETLKLDLEVAKERAGLYCATLVEANFNYTSLENAVINYVPAAPEFEGEPEQTVYGYLLDTLRDIPFEKYPRKLSDTDLDAHQTNIVRITLDYFTSGEKNRAQSSTPPPAPAPRAVGEEEDGFIGPMPSNANTVPVGGNTIAQLPQRRYVMLYVAVDTISVDGRLVPWQVSVHIPGLPEDEDPDYECLMVPNALADRPKLLEDLGFTYEMERKSYYHHGSEFGRRKAEPEEVSVEKFGSFLDVSA